MNDINECNNKTMDDNRKKIKKLLNDSMDLLFECKILCKYSDYDYYYYKRRYDEFKKFADEMRELL